MAATAGIWKLIEAKQTLQTFVSWGEQERRHAEAASEAARNAASDWTQSLSLAAQAQDNFSLMVASTSELTAAAGAASDAAKRLQKEEKDAAEEAKKRAEAQKVATDYWKKEMDRQISVLQEWEKESVKIGVSITEAELTELERRRQYFAEFVQDEAKLAQWLADEKRAIMIRANNEQIALYTELIESGKREYADRLIELYREIEEANKAKNTLILKSEQQAQEIMEIRMQKHIDRIKQMIGEVSETAVETARETVGAIEGIYENSATASAAVAAPSFSPGAVTGGGTIDVVYGRTFFNDRAGAHAYQRQMEEMNRTLKQVQENTAKTAAAAAEQAAREAQRAYEEKRSLLDNAYGRYAAYIQAQERSTWGRVQYESEFYRLAEAFGSSQYFEESVNLLDEMLDVIQELDTIAQAQLEQQKQQTASLQAGSRSISDWLIDLSQGSLVPVQSAAGWASRFEELRTEAMADEARISDFLSYAQRYLEFEKAYGDSESYSQAYGSIVESVQDLGDWMDLASRLSQLGLGDNLGDISALITAFGNLGVSIGELKAAADTAQGSGLSALAATLGDSLPSAAGTASSLTGTLATTLQNTETPFGNVTAALNDMGSNVQSRLQVVSDFFTGLAERMGLTFNEASAGTAIGNLTKTEYTQAAKYVVQVVENTPYQPEMGYWDYGIPMTSIDDKWVVTRYARPATYKTIWSDGTVTVAGEGALTDGLTLAGEIGPEWVVPTYEPERSRFLESAPPEFWGNMGLGVQPGGGGATLDADAIGRSVGRQIAAALGNDADGKEIHVHLHIDGREIASVVADQYRQGNRNLIEQTKRRMQ